MISTRKSEVYIEIGTGSHFGAYSQIGRTQIGSRMRAQSGCAANTGSDWMRFDTFAGAERFHAGGMLGLRPDEVPFVGLRGEEVLTRNDPRHRWNAERLDRIRMPTPTNDVQVNVYDMRIGRDQPPARTEQRRGADGKREIAVFIEDKIDEAIRSGRLDRAQGETYGSRRLTKRV